MTPGTGDLVLLTSSEERPEEMRPGLPACRLLLLNVDLLSPSSAMASDRPEKRLGLDDLGLGGARWLNSGYDGGE